MTRLGTSLPLVRGSFPVRYLMGLFLPWHLPVLQLWKLPGRQVKAPFWDLLGNDRSGPNPGREPFGARFWQFGLPGRN